VQTWVPVSLERVPASRISGSRGELTSELSKKRPNRFPEWLPPSLFPCPASTHAPASHVLAKARCRLSEDVYFHSSELWPLPRRRSTRLRPIIPPAAARRPGVHPPFLPRRLVGLHLLQEGLPARPPVCSSRENHMAGTGQGCGLRELRNESDLPQVNCRTKLRMLAPMEGLSSPFLSLTCMICWD